MVVRIVDKQMEVVAKGFYSRLEVDRYVREMVNRDGIIIMEYI